MPAYGKLKVQLTYRGLFYPALPHCQKHAAQVADPHKVLPSSSPFRGLQRTHSNSWVGPTAKGVGGRDGQGGHVESQSWRPCDLALPFTDGEAEARRGKSIHGPLQTGKAWLKGMTPTSRGSPGAPGPALTPFQRCRGALPCVAPSHPGCDSSHWRGALDTRSFTLSFSAVKRGQRQDPRQRRARDWVGLRHATPYSPFHLRPRRRGLPSRTHHSLVRIPSQPPSMSGELLRACPKVRQASWSNEVPTGNRRGDLHESNVIFLSSWSILMNDDFLNTYLSAEAASLGLLVPHSTSLAPKISLQGRSLFCGYRGRPGHAGCRWMAVTLGQPHPQARASPTARLPLGPKPQGPLALRPLEKARF